MVADSAKVCIERYCMLGLRVEGRFSVGATYNPNVKVHSVSRIAPIIVAGAEHLCLQQRLRFEHLVAFCLVCSEDIQEPLIL